MKIYSGSFWDRFALAFIAGLAITVGLTLLCYQFSEAVGNASARMALWVALGGALQFARQAKAKPADDSTKPETK